MVEVGKIEKQTKITLIQCIVLSLVNFIVLIQSSVSLQFIVPLQVNNSMYVFLYR